MKSKSLNFIIASVFALVFLASVVSAASISEWSLTEDGTSSNVASHVNAGTFISNGVNDFNFHATNGAFAENWSIGSDPLDNSKYFEVKISSDTGYNLKISDIDFYYGASITGPASFELRYSLNDFSTWTSIVTKDDVTSSEEKISTNNVDILVEEGKTLTLRWYGYNFDADTNEFRIKDLSIEGTVESTKQNFCEYEDNGNLKINIEDISVIEGFGDDNEWLPFDEVEIEIEVENKGEEDINDIVVEWGLYNLDKEEFVIDDEESDFNLNEDEKETITIKFKLDDIDDFEDEDDYVFYAWATGEDEEFDDEKTCRSDSEDVEVIIESDFVILEDLKVPEVVQCDSEVQITADVWNIGDSDQDEVIIILYNKELGLSEEIEIGDIDEFDSEPLDFTFQLPEDAEEKTYPLKLTIYDEDKDIYENDFDDEESIFNVFLKVQGSCSVEKEASVSAVLESGGRSGEPLVVKATIVNTGEDSTSYNLNAAGYAEWASSATLDKNTITLGAGQSQEVLLTFQVKKEALGDYLFNLEVLSENELVLNKPVQVAISKKGLGITGGAIFGGDNWYLWGIGALNVILVVLIIVIAIRIARK